MLLVGHLGLPLTLRAAGQAAPRAAHPFRIRYHHTQSAPGTGGAYVRNRKSTILLPQRAMHGLLFLHFVEEALDDEAHDDQHDDGNDDRNGPARKNAQIHDNPLLLVPKF